jgi:hypothetical protein
MYPSLKWENTMSENISAQELSAEELNDVSGGVKKVDKSSAKLLLACATGEHLSTELAPTSPTQQELSDSALQDVVGGAAATAVRTAMLTCRKAGKDQQE